MRTARRWVVLIGVMLPFVVRIPGVATHGEQWLTSYLGCAAPLLLSAFNAICWGSILLGSYLYRHAWAILFPALSGFGYLAWQHARLDLSADAQASLALIFIPIYSLPFVLVGWLFGLAVDVSVSWAERQSLTNKGRRESH